MALADRNDERQLVVSSLGNVPTTEALAPVASSRSSLPVTIRE